MSYTLVACCLRRRYVTHPRPSFCLPRRLRLKSRSLYCSMGHHRYDQPCPPFNSPAMFILSHPNIPTDRYFFVCLRPQTTQPSVEQNSYLTPPSSSYSPQAPRAYNLSSFQSHAVWSSHELVFLSVPPECSAYGIKRLTLVMRLVVAL